MYGCGPLSLAWVASGGLDVFIDLTGQLKKHLSLYAGLALIKSANGYWEYVVGTHGQKCLVAGLNEKLVTEVSALLTT